MIFDFDNFLPVYKQSKRHIIEEVSLLLSMHIFKRVFCVNTNFKIMILDPLAYNKGLF